MDPALLPVRACVGEILETKNKKLKVDHTTVAMEGEVKA